MNERRKRRHSDNRIGLIWNGIMGLTNAKSWPLFRPSVRCSRDRASCRRIGYGATPHLKSQLRLQQEFARVARLERRRASGAVAHE